MRPLAFAAAVLALALPFQSLSQTPPARPFVRENVTEKISNNVHVIPDFGVGGVPNVGIIVGPKGVLVVDTGMGARNAEAILREVNKAVPLTRDLYLVTTHIHPEHDLGAHAFPARTIMLRSRGQEEEIAEQGLSVAQRFASNSPINAELLRGATFRPASINFADEYPLDLGGGVKVRIMAMGANHTRGDTAIFVEPDGVLFSGDVVMKAQPAFASPASSLRHWLTSLDKLEALKPRIIVPSHGPMGGVEQIAGYRAYLREIQSRAVEVKTPPRIAPAEDEAVKGIVDAMVGRYPNRGRLEGAVRVGWREAEPAR